MLPFVLFQQPVHNCTVRWRGACQPVPVTTPSQFGETLKIKVLLADDSDMMRSAIRRTLEEEPRIQVVGEAPSFAKTMQMIADYKPDVLLLDLRLAEKRDFAPEFVKAQLATVRNVVAVSFSNDHEAQDLAKSYGAVALLDKMTLYTEMIPAILHCEPKETDIGIGSLLRKLLMRRAHAA
jgi:PleD family two-component response regulator